MEKSKMNDEINVKMIDFSILPVGEKFFMSRPAAIDDKTYYTKIPSLKSSAGAWSNARGPLSNIFIKYDARVWVRK